MVWEGQIFVSSTNVQEKLFHFLWPQLKSCELSVGKLKHFTAFFLRGTCSDSGMSTVPRGTVYLGCKHPSNVGNMFFVLSCETW